MSNNSAPLSYLMEAGGVASSAYGKYTGDGSGAVTIALGFPPMRVTVFNETDNTFWDWNAGMAATKSFKNVAGTQTVDTSSAIVSNHVISTRTTSGVYDPAGNGPGDGTLINTSVTVDTPDLTIPKLILATGLNTSAKLYSWVAFG